MRCSGGPTHSFRWPTGLIVEDGQRTLVIEARGTPAPQGSKRYVGGGRMIESSAKVRPWRLDVKAAAEALIEPYRPGWVPMDGPLRVRMVFTLRKPVSVRREWPDRTPDLSKLLRSTEDALTDAGVWADDARVVDYERAAKTYPSADHESLDTPGVYIMIKEG